MRTLLSNRDAVDLAQVRRFIVGTLSTDQAENIGETIYVDGTAGSNAFDGKSPDRAKLTITAALAVAVAGDVVAVFPGTYAEHVTMAVANVSLVGLGDVPRQVLLSDVAAVATPYINITAQGCCVGNLRISPLNAANVACIQVSNVPNCLVEKCEFYIEPTGVVALDVGVRLVGAIAECFHTTIRGCIFDGHTDGIMFVANATMPNGTLIEYNTFLNGVTSDITDNGVATAVTLVWIRYNNFLGLGNVAPTDFIVLDQAGSTGVICQNVFNFATHNILVIVVPATILTISNYTLAGCSVAQVV